MKRLSNKYRQSCCSISQYHQWIAPSKQERNMDRKLTFNFMLRQMTKMVQNFTIQTNLFLLINTCFAMDVLFLSQSFDLHRFKSFVEFIKLFFHFPFFCGAISIKADGFLGLTTLTNSLFLFLQKSEDIFFSFDLDCFNGISSQDSNLLTFLTDIYPHLCPQKPLAGNDTIQYDTSTISKASSVNGSRPLPNILLG